MYESDALPNKPTARPAFHVKKAEGTFTKVMMVPLKDKEGKHKGFERKEVTTPMGWMVTIPKGKDMMDEIHIETMAEMTRLGFDKTIIPLVDHDGEVVGAVKNPTKVKEAA